MNTPFADLIVGNYTRLDVPTEKKYDGELARSQEDACQTVETRSATKRKKMEKEKVESSLELSKEISTDEWIEEQRKDPALDVLRKRVGNDVSKEGETLITLEKGMLYRHFKSHTKEMIKQLVVPTKFRRQILQLGHDIPMAGHLGIKKTRERILKYFFWSEIFNDTKQYCRSCPKCQKGTSKTQVSKVPLVQIPRIDVPFQRIAIDMVGPLPRTKRGNQYVLVICDYATKYPEAILLRNQEAEVVAEAIIEVFSRLRVPKEILSDKGTNFMSSLMSELCKLLSIRKLNTTPYHPQANGLVERFNGTLKRMLQIYAQDQPGKWDKLLPYLLFAYREVPQESTRFAPFELMYGRHVRGPLAIMRESINGEDDESRQLQPSVLSYIIDTREKLAEMADLVSEKEQDSKADQKRYYDRNAGNRSFEVGNKVAGLVTDKHTETFSTKERTFSRS